MLNNKNTTDEYEKHIAENSGDYSVLPNDKYRSIIAKIVCVLAAVVLWFYVVITDTTIEEKTFNGITVTIRNVDRIEQTLGLSVINGYDRMVDVTVSGARSDINNITAEDITVYVDADEISSSGEYQLPVRSSLPDGIKLKELSANFITVYMDRRTSITVPIKVTTVQTIDSNYTMGTPEPNIESVNVTGPSEELENIDYAEVSLDLGRVTKSLRSTGRLVLIDKSGNKIDNPYIKLQTTDVNVKIPVYAQKEVPLAVEYKYGYFNDSNVKVTIDPVSITVKGDPEDIDSLDRIILMQIDEKKITGDSVQTSAIMLPSTIENISGVTSATVKITHKGTETREIVVSGITVLNPNNLSYTLEDQSINVRFRGTKSLLALLNSSNVTATIDLGYLTTTAGKVSVPVTISVASALSDSVYEIGEYKMNVQIG